MSRKTNRTIVMLAAVLMGATLAPSAGLAYHDLRFQDALDAARSLPPDQLVAVSEGLRSTAPKPTSVRVRQSDGFDWPSAVIGAAGLLGLIGVSFAVLLGIRQITRRPRWLTDSLLLSTHADGEGRASVMVRGDENVPAPALTGDRS